MLLKPLNFIERFWSLRGSVRHYQSLKHYTVRRNKRGTKISVRLENYRNRGIVYIVSNVACLSQRHLANSFIDNMFILSCLETHDYLALCQAVI